MKRELRFQPDPEYPEETIVRFDDNEVSIAMEYAARLDEPPYYCVRLALEAGGRGEWYLPYHRDWSNMLPFYDYGASVPTKVLREVIAILDAADGNTEEK